jgi:hypothetical protein
MVDGGGRSGPQGKLRAGQVCEPVWLGENFTFSLPCFDFSAW